jgi:AraC-like DNA-binding protein
MVLLDHGGRAAAEFDIVAPPADLSGVIEHLWVGRRPPAGVSGWRVVPDASPHLIAAVTESGPTRAIRVRLVGARSCAATIDVRQRVVSVGVRFRPGAVPALVDASAREFVDRSVAVDDVLSADVLTELELGPDAPPPMIGHELIRLVRRACRRRTARTMLRDAVPSASTVAELARQLDEPMRSLRERAHRELGLSPKRTLRVLRLHAALHARRNGHSWSEVAYAAGYADQTHLARELRALLGETRLRWQARGSAVSFKTANRAIG